jgi:predicted DNA-binding transcriptional regulator YafY
LSRTARLLELLIRVQTKPRFTAAELAEEFGVSRRTMLRDLGALSAMGVPLRSTPGPGGGYSLPRGGKRLSPHLTVDEALALIASYEALLRYPVHPFSTQSLSAVTKLRAALPREVVAELDSMRRHVFVGGPARDYEAPLLGELLSAALDGAHLKVRYDSIGSGVTERVIFLIVPLLKKVGPRRSFVAVLPLPLPHEACHLKGSGVFGSPVPLGSCPRISR